jgi:hypothetical protein
MIEQIQTRLGLDGTAFKKGLTSAKADWKRFTSDIGGDIRSMFGFGAAVAGAKMLGEEMLALKRRAEDLGVGVEFVQSIEQLSMKFGGTAEDASVALTKLAETMGQARTEGGAAAEKFSSLGISLYDSNGLARSTEQVFKDIANAYKNTGDAALKAALAVEFFGKTGRNINNILGEGAEGIDDYTRTMMRFGVVASAQNVEAVASAWNSVKTVTGGIATTVAGFFLRLGMLRPTFLAAMSAGLSPIKAAMQSWDQFWNENAESILRSRREDDERARAARAAAELHIKTMDAQLELEEKIKQSKYEQADNYRKILALDQEIKQLMEDAADAAKTEIERIEAKSKLIDKEKEKLKVIGEIENERQKKAEEHMGRMDKLNELKDKQRQAQETVADRARFSLDELANANLRGVRDPGTRADIIKAREVRDLQARAERERLSGAVGSRERALDFLSKADKLRQAITSLRSDERLTSIDRSLLEMKENDKQILHYYENAGVLVRPVMAK